MAKLIDLIGTDGLKGHELSGMLHVFDTSGNQRNAGSGDTDF